MDLYTGLLHSNYRFKGLLGGWAFSITIYMYTVSLPLALVKLCAW